MVHLDTGQRRSGSALTPRPKSARRREQEAEHGEALPGGRLQDMHPKATHMPARDPSRSALEGHDSVEQVLFKRSRSGKSSRRQQAGAGVGNVNDGCKRCIPMPVQPPLTALSTVSTPRQFLHVHRPINQNQQTQLATM